MSDQEKRKSGRVKRYSEKKIEHIKELKTLLWGLDLDEGIRLVAQYPTYENGAFIFLTKSDSQYCVNIKNRVVDDKSGVFVPGEKEQWKYFETAEDAWSFISKYLKTPLEAYYY